MIDRSRHRKRHHAPLRHGRRIDWRKPLWFLGFSSISMLVMVLTVLSRTDTLLTSAMLRNEDKTWDADVLHIVITRFMQDQANLLHLARARLLLFETICLPTMVKQSTQQFVWIIQTDPHLDREIRNSLTNLLKPYPNYFLIGSNLQIQGQTFRTIGKIFLKSPLYSGNVKLLRQAYLLRNSLPLLQTRLDADDGLEMTYLKLLQDEAIKLFHQSGLDWHYWCIKRHLEWYSNANALNSVEHSKLCPTPGLTVGLGVPPLAQEPPLELAHDVLFKTIVQQNHVCHAAPGMTKSVGNACVRMVDDIVVGAIRSRTWTSAGMMNIFDAGVHGIPQEQLWEVCRQRFGVSNLKRVALYLQSHLAEIAKDNLEGQCTNGHSCKLNSLETLQRLIDVQREGGNLEAVKKAE